MDASGLLWLERGHWGLTTAVYLFFASLGGGAYLAGVGAHVIPAGGERRDRLAFARWAFLVALVAVAIAGLAILSHLADPVAGLLFPLTLTNLDSWITRGTWILVALGAFAALQTLWFHFGAVGRDASGASAVLRRLAGRLGVRPVADRVADASRPGGGWGRVVGALGLVPALGTVYTGFELAAVAAVPLWHHPAVVPWLFLASGTAAGVATALALTTAFDESSGRLVVASGGVVGLGLLATAGLLWALWTGLESTRAGAASAELLTSGALLAPVAVLVVGLLVSLVGSPLLAWLVYARGSSGATGRVVRPVLVAALASGVLATFLIRYVLLFAAVKQPVVVLGG